MIKGIEEPLDVGACRKCNRRLIWIRNENGKIEPFDSRPTRMLVLPADMGTEGNTYRAMLVKGRVNHFMTCPYADDFRSPRSGGAKT